MMNPNQMKGIAEAVAALRPSWDAQGVRAALMKVKDRDPFDVALAAIKAARETVNRTPAVIPLAGEHWLEAKPAKADHRAARLDAAKASMAAIRNCALCDEAGYRLPKRLILCTHAPLRRWSREGRA